MSKEILQGVFDRVAKHLLTQNKKARLEDEDTCAYRGAEGTKCAVGCLITDEAYDYLMEGEALVGVIVRDGSWTALSILPESRGHRLANALNASGVPTEAAGLLQCLQDVHDATTPNFWRGQLVDLARRYGLTFGDYGV